MAFCAFAASLVMAKPSQRQGELHDEVIEDRKVAKIRTKAAASDIKEPKRPDEVLSES